ncbi:hypothetical protein [Flavobacterium sp. LC2016-12]|uniref:hypothetical protein n=1 Tax=Flavobacterium sp. LC2016-12 TaxID=2783794 RepID=UPI00188A345E|nr:hypothetical protein [Flavobacterium sp. LC2016-12]MBF4464285.1 hypothetical protein [Flavobacterium sp. LC2016-12]
MINISTPQNTGNVLVLFFFFLTFLGHAQIGIGTVTPNVSSVLDITSTTKGMLAPRMTTAQRTAIVTPAESLLVYDTTVKAFYYYNLTTTSWVKIANEGSALRNNYKLVKSVTDLAPELLAGGNTRYLLTSNTLYEINGTIALTAPIDLNNAYVSGLDTNEDILQAPGVVFQGSTGGSIRNVTLQGASAFNITGPGIASNTSLLVQNTVISGMTAGVGTISGLGLYFGNIVQFVTNNGGITYSNIGNLLLSNQAWFSSNVGTFETFTGNFSLIQKNSGFSTVDVADVAMNVSGLTSTSVGTGILIGTVFSGTTTAPSGIINRYPAGSTYPGYNFSNAWTVDSPGIPREGDSDATGDINLSANVGSGVSTTFSGTGTASRKKLVGTTTSNNLFRFTRDGDNIITYRGNKTRYFQVVASVSYQTTADATFIFYIAKNNTVLTETKVYGRASSGLLTTAGIVAVPIIGSVQMKTGDIIEIWAERYDGLGNLSTVSLNLTAR